MPTDPSHAFVHPAAHVIGNVTLGARVSVWPTAVLRGDRRRIGVGEDSNVQDGTIVHVDPGVPCTIGARVAIGHRAIVHGATVADDCLIGMGAIVLNRVSVGSGSIVGAGAVCRKGWRSHPTRSSSACPRRCSARRREDERERIAHTVGRISRCRWSIARGSAQSEEIDESS